MKVTVIPAQVTTVEDRIMGTLSFSQMILLVLPVFLSAALFAALPPVMSGSLCKYILMATLASVCCILAIRIKGKILAFWFIIILRYNLRPKLYLFDKNTTVYREQYETSQTEEPVVEDDKNAKTMTTSSHLPFDEAMKLVARLENPTSSLRFETTKKGALHVRFTEVKE